MKQLFIYVAAALFAMPAFAVENSDTTSILSTLHSETLQASKEARPQTLKECLEKDSTRTTRSASSATKSRWLPIMPPWRMLACSPR